MPFLSSTLALSVLLAVHALRTDGELDGSTVWLTVCTPPACSPASPLLNNTRQTSGLPVVVLEQLRGRTVSMQGLQRTRKLHMIREYLLSEEGRRWHTVRSLSLRELPTTPKPNPRPETVCMCAS